MRNIAKQILLFCSLILFISFITFLLIEISPIDPILSFARSRSVGLTPDEKQKLIMKWGLNKPLFIRYILWIKNLLRGDLGISNIYNRPVIEIILRGFSSSALLMGVAWICQGIFGIFLGIVAGSNIGSLKDRIIKYISLTLAATPSFYIGIVLIILFSLRWKFFPVTLGTPIGVEDINVSLWDRITHMILPCITLVICGISNLILHTRTKVEEILNSDYILYARAKGMKNSEIVLKYALKNMILPGLTLQFTYFSELFSGTILVENVFNYPGLGNLMVESGLRADIPLLLGLVVFSSIFVYVGNRTCDLLYGIIDGRLRRENEI